VSDGTDLRGAFVARWHYAGNCRVVFPDGFDPQALSRVFSFATNE
jgi:hypothetical protein